MSIDERIEAFNAHCDELADLVDEREDALKASAAACGKMAKSVRGMRWSLLTVFIGNVGMMLAMACVIVR